MLVDAVQQFTQRGGAVWLQVDLIADDLKLKGGSSPVIRAPCKRCSPPHAHFPFQVRLRVAPIEHHLEAVSFSRIFSVPEQGVRRATGHGADAGAKHRFDPATNIEFHRFARGNKFHLWRDDSFARIVHLADVVAGSFATGPDSSGESKIVRQYVLLTLTTVSETKIAKYREGIRYLCALLSRRGAGEGVQMRDSHLVPDR